ncbi:MAG: LuxR family transcriptional regulator [Alphaproteobacteria bacterium]|nr:LuxR family transcriptional regulator [Alphaproteobacteria bacterium]
MRIDDYIEATNQAKSQDDVFALFQSAAAALGYDRMMYRALRNHPDTTLPCVAKTYPEEWIAHYVAKGYVDTDPVGVRMLVSGLPFLWWEAVQKGNRHAGTILNEAEEFGLKDGAAVPIHGPNGECVGIGFASTTGGIDGRSSLSKLQLMAVQFHTAYSALAQPRQLTAIHLTPREREILLWCGRGKSSWAIGEILHIAENSVEWHLKNIFRKLSVDSRVTAVVKALHLGLIFL